MATQVLDKDMLYLMKAYQSSLSKLGELSSTVNLLENTAVLVECFMDKNRPVPHTDSCLAELQKAFDVFNCWVASATESRHMLSRECSDDLKCAVAEFLVLCDRVLEKGDIIKTGYFNS